MSVKSAVTSTSDRVKEYAKAVVGALVAAAGVFTTANGDGNVTTNEWVGVVLAFVVSFAAVALTTNVPPEDTVAD